MATIDGARALGLQDVTGSLTPGKRADVVMIRKHDLNVAPVGDPESTVVRCDAVASRSPLPRSTAATLVKVEPTSAQSATGLPPPSPARASLALTVPARPRCRSR